jgi:hypothetical protein
MIQHATLIINVKVQGLRESESIWLTKVLLLPFAPVPGHKIQLWREDGEIKELDLINLSYSLKDSCFIEEQEDDSVREALEAEEEVELQDTVAEYESYGFVVQAGL